MPIRSKRILKEAEIHTLAHRGETLLQRKFVAATAAIHDDAGKKDAETAYKTEQETFRQLCGGDVAEVAVAALLAAEELLSAIGEALEASRSSVAQEVINTLRAARSKYQ